VANERAQDLDVAVERFRLRVVALVVGTLIMDVLCAVATYLTEQGAKDEFATVWQALFFCTTQLLTVSSQLPNPENAGTKVIDIVMEAWGVFVVAGGAAIVADLLHHRTRHHVITRRSQ
jgi:hypothetical protein